MATDEAKLIVKFEAENQKLHKELERTQKRMKRFETSAKKNVDGIKRAFAVGLGAISFVALTRKMFDVTKKQEAAIKQLEQGLASTGNVVGRSLEVLTARAAELQKASTFGDEEIIAGMSQLVTFTNITGDAFDRTTQAVLDLSTRMDQDLKSSVLQLGKALNDPVANLGALGRAGIQFSDAQEEMIKGLAKTNRLAEAQGIILDELERQFGGSAQAARDTLAGALASLDNAWGDLLENKQGTNELTGSINTLTDLLQDPATVQAVQSLTGAIVSGFNAAVRAVTNTVNVVRFLAEEFAAFVHGPALGDLPRLNDELDDLIAKRDRLVNGTGRNRGRADQISAVDAEIAKIRNLISLSEEMAATKAPQVSVPGVASVATSTAPAAPADTSKFDTLAASLRQQVALYGEVGEAAKIRYQVENNLIEGLTAEQGQVLINLAEQKDAMDSAAASIDAMFAAEDAAAQAQRDYAASINDLLANSMSPLDQQLRDTRENMLLLTQAMEEMPAKADQIGQAMIYWQGEEAKLLEQIRNGTEEISVWQEEAVRNLQGVFRDFFLDIDQGFDGLLDSFLDVMNKIIANAASNQIGKYLFGENGKGGALNSGGGVLGTIGQALFSYDGGGYTGDGPRAGGMDGKGGFLAMMHPQEIVTDLHGAAVNSGGGGGETKVVVNNVYDPAEIAQVMASAHGQKVITEAIKRNAGEVSRYLSKAR